MIKMLQKIMLLVAVITVTGHSIFPHIHSKETVAAEHKLYHDLFSGNHHHDEEESNDDNENGILSFAPLDDNFIPATAQTKNFELPAECLVALIVTYLSDSYPVITKTHFGCYKEFPPPKKYFPSSSHRGPPTV